MIKYEVNKDMRTVSAEINGCADDMVRRMTKLCHSRPERAGVEALQIRDNYRVVVKCHPDDTFDEKVGKALAKKRLLNRYHFDCSKALCRFEAMTPDYGEKASIENQRILQILSMHN